MTVQMSHPGIIIQTVTSEDLSELEAEHGLVKDHPTEDQNNSGGEEHGEQSSKDVQNREKVSSSRPESKCVYPLSKSLNPFMQTLISCKVEENENSGIGGGAVLMVPSPSSFIPSNEDIGTDSVLPLGTLTGTESIDLSESLEKRRDIKYITELTVCFSL